MRTKVPDQIESKPAGPPTLAELVAAGARIRECAADEAPTPGLDLLAHAPLTGLDPTPVDDLEAWHADYDPVAAAEFDTKLDDFFGPYYAAARGDIEWARHGRRGVAS